MLHTERLLIRPMLLDDWIDVRAIAFDFRAGPYAQYDRPLPDTDIALQEVVRFFAKSGSVHSVLLKEGGPVIGYVCLWSEGETLELGYCFHSDHHGKGYAFEAITALIEHVCAEKEVSSILCGTALDNAPSMRLISRLGFELIETGFTSFYQDEDGNDIFFPSGRFQKNLQPLVSR